MLLQFIDYKMQLLCHSQNADGKRHSTKSGAESISLDDPVQCLSTSDSSSDKFGYTVDYPYSGAGSGENADKSERVSSLHGDTKQHDLKLSSYCRVSMVLRINQRRGI